MIHDVQKLNEGRFLINNSVVISEFEYEDEGVSYKLDYDENITNESDAIKLCEEFINQSIENFLKKL